MTAEALATEMKSPANINMTKNAPCNLSEADLDDIAAKVMQLPIAAA